MNNERDQLSKNLEICGQKLEETKKIIWEREIGCSKKTDEVSENA
jgi:hypothetical protein